MKLAIAAFFAAVVWLTAPPAEAGWFGGKKKPPEPEHVIMDGKKSAPTTMKGGQHAKKYDQWSWGRNAKLSKLRAPTLHPYIRGY